MEAVQAYFDGKAFVPIAPVKAEINQQAIITILDSGIYKPGKKWFNEFFGVLSLEDAEEIKEALKGSEKVDSSEW